MDESKIKRLMKMVEDQENVPTEIRNRILENVFSDSLVMLNRFESFVFSKPIRSSIAFSIAVSALLFAIMGDDYYWLLIH